MSISSMPLPPPSSHQPAPLVSASVTRILTLSNFSPELKTRDLQGVFARWADDRGGFKIKWIDDITALAVFADASVAKRAYLALILDPPAILPPPATIRPYDGPDAQAIIHSVAARTHGGPAGANGHASRASFAGSSAIRPAIPGAGQGASGSFSIPPPAAPGVHARASSVSGGMAGGQRFAGGFNGVLGGPSVGVGTQSIRHDRGSSMSSTSGAGSSWGRNSVPGVLSGFQGGSLGAERNTSRLPTHIEADSPIKSAHNTPTQAQTSGFAASSLGSQPRYAPTFRSASPDSHSASSRDDLTSPPLDVVGGVAVEGGPGGRGGAGAGGGGGVRVTDGGKRMAHHGMGVRSMHAASQPSFGSSLQHTTNGNGAGSNGSNGNGNNPALVSDFVNSKVRRESLDPASAEKAMRQVENALKGLGVSGSALED